VERIRYSDASGGRPVYVTKDADGILHAPDGFKFRNGYTAETEEPLVPLRRGYAIRHRNAKGYVTEFLRWDDDTGESVRLAAWRLWRRTGRETMLLRFPVSRVEGIYPYSDTLETVQHWGSRR